MLSDQFSQIFRDEHREIRDTLLDLIVAFQERDRLAFKRCSSRRLSVPDHIFAMKKKLCTLHWLNSLEKSTLKGYCRIMTRR